MILSLETYLYCCWEQIKGNLKKSNLKTYLHQIKCPSPTCMAIIRSVTLKLLKITIFHDFFLFYNYSDSY